MGVSATWMQLKGSGAASPQPSSTTTATVLPLGSRGCAASSHGFSSAAGLVAMRCDRLLSVFQKQNWWVELCWVLAATCSSSSGRVLLVAVARLLCSGTGRLSARIEVSAQEVYRCNERAFSNSLFRETAIRSPVVLGGCVVHLALAPTIRDFKLCSHDVTWGRLVVVGSCSCASRPNKVQRSSRFEEQPNGLRTGPRRKETAADRPLKPRITRCGDWRRWYVEAWSPSSNPLLYSFFTRLQITAGCE